MKVCYQCKLKKSLDEFAFKNKTKGIKQGSCRKCHSAYMRKHYAENLIYYRTKAKVRRQEHGVDSVRKLIRHLKTNVPCVDCKTIFPYYVMDFDHLDNKVHNVSKITKMETVIEEVKKCEIVCSNCHRIRTHKRLMRS